MYAVFENTNEDFRFIDKKSVHVPPHIHTAVEIVYITKGTQEVGVLQELYHMEEGDVAVLTAGLPLGISGTTNLIKAQIV